MKNRSVSTTFNFEIKKMQTSNGLDELLGGVGLRLAHHDDAADAELLDRDVVASVGHLQHLQLRKFKI